MASGIASLIVAPRSFSTIIPDFNAIDESELKHGSASDGRAHVSTSTGVYQGFYDPRGR
jgi:hypothetical protein